MQLPHDNFLVIQEARQPQGCAAAVVAQVNDEPGDLVGLEDGQRPLKQADDQAQVVVVGVDLNIADP